MWSGSTCIPMLVLLWVPTTEIVAVPRRSALTNPLLSTLRTVGSDEDQVKVSFEVAAPLLSRTCANSCMVSPEMSAVRSAETTTVPERFWAQPATAKDKMKISAEHPLPLGEGRVRVSVFAAILWRWPLRGGEAFSEADFI